MGAFLTFQKDADGIYPGWKEKLGYTGESSVQAASFDWKKKAAAAAFVGAAAAKKESVVACHALDQSSRYADLSIDEGSLSKNGRHVLVAYIMKPKARRGPAYVVSQGGHPSRPLYSIFLGPSSTVLEIPVRLAVRPGGL
jgi:hypothetical protein